MDIFISHASADSGFVDALQNLLRLALRLSSEQIRATSIEATQLEPGANVDNELRREIQEAPMFVAVLSPASLRSTYAMFELGARWGALNKNKQKIFPIVLPGMTPDMLEAPLKNLHVSECNQTGLWKLIQQSADVLKVKPEKPDAVQAALTAVLSYKSTHLEPLAYAVLAYVLDESEHFALLKDPHYEKLQPPGRRLRFGEQPHLVALERASEELDLPIDELRRFPAFKEIRYKSTRVVAPPYQLQLEKNPHKEALAHYDFVYAFTVDGTKPYLRTTVGPKFEPDWYSLAEVESRQGHKQWGPHEDMVVTMKRIVADHTALRGS